MRAMWTGAVSFGLVSVPVKLYAATENHSLRFHQVHGGPDGDGGRIRYKRVCEVCGNEVDYADIVKGLDGDDGELITLDEADLESLPVASGNREIDVVEFVPSDQVDPMLLDRSYYLEPEPRAVKPYALLREALRQTERSALVKVAIRQRETLALLRVRDNVIVLHTMLWPDEVREPEFENLDSVAELREQELAMASSLVDSLGADFDPTRFTDEYRDAMLELIDRKRAEGESRPVPAPAAATAGDGDGSDGMTDLLTALQRSVEAARAEAGGTTETGAAETGKPASGAASGSHAKPPAKSGGTPKRAAKVPAQRKKPAETGSRKATGKASSKRSRDSA